MSLGRLIATTALPAMVGRVLRRERLAQKLTQADVAERIGRTKSYVHDLEMRSNKGITIVRLELVAGALGLRSSDVLREAEAMRFHQSPVAPEFATKEVEAAQ